LDVAAPSSTITIRRVGEGASVSDFIQVAHVTQGHDPHWVAPLSLLEAPRLNPKKNPWFTHGEAQLFIAYKDGKPAGRISAQVDRSHLERYQDSTGFFGFFETVDDLNVSGALFSAAADWLRARNITRCVGPFSFNVNDESGLLIDGFNCPPRMMMGHAQPYYAAHVEAAGFGKIVDMRAYLTPMDTAIPFKQIKWLRRALDRNPTLKVRPIDMSRFKEEIASVARIFNAAWAGNWGYIPMTEIDIAHMAAEMRPIIVPELSAIATVDGVPAAMCLALPDLNEMTKDLKGSLAPFGWARLGWRLLNRRTFCSGTRVPLMGVMPEYKNKPLGSMLALLTVGAMRDASIRLRMPVCEMSWVLESNTQTCHSIEDIGGRVYKTYRMYEKSLL
jgi:hypothetical protein